MNSMICSVRDMMSNTQILVTYIVFLFHLFVHMK